MQGNGTPLHMLDLYDNWKFKVRISMWKVEPYFLKKLFGLIERKKHGTGLEWSTSHLSTLRWCGNHYVYIA
jgi:hypothetical protein